MMSLLALVLPSLWGCSAPPMPEGSHPDRLDAPAEVRFDQEGVAHIYGATEDDVFFMQGYVTAHDRLFQMDLLRRRAHGRRAEVLGEALVGSDRQSRALRFTESGEASLAVLEQDDPEIFRAMCAYAAGVSQYIADAQDGAGVASLPPQFDALGYTPEPWTAADSAAIEKLITAGLAMRPDQDLILGLLKMLLGDDFFADVYQQAPFDEATTVPGFLEGVQAAARPPQPGSRSRSPLTLPGATPEALVELFHHAEAWNMSMGGSNNMAIDAAHSDSGYALLGSDSHQGIAHPAVYYVVHLSTARDGGDLDVVGATFPGVPFVMFGHNQRVAWGPTTSIFDVADAYLEVMPSDDEVLWEGEAVPIEVTDHTIAVAGGTSVPFEARYVPHHGPMMPTEGLPLPLNVSIRWTGYQPRSAARTFLALSRADSFAAFREGLLHYYTGGMHWLYADVDGNIGYSSYTHVPLRAVLDPETPPITLLPGQGGYEWRSPPDDAQDGVPYARLDESLLPWTQNPDQGWLTTANNDPVGQTHDGDAFNDPIYLSGVFDIGTRAYQAGRRFEQEIAADGGVSYEELRAIQLDTRSRLAERLVPFILEAAARRPDLIPDARTQAAVDLLADWPDFDCPVDRAQPTLFHAWLSLFTRDVLEDEAGGLLGDLLFEEMDARFGLVTTKFIAHFLELTADNIDAIEAGELPFPSRTGDNYFDDQRTEALETRDAVILGSLVEALDQLAVIYADRSVDPADPATYLWGAYHTIQLVDAADAVLPEASSAVYPKPGGLFTIDVADYLMLEGGVLPETLVVDNAPSNRFLHELVPDAIRAEWVLPGGQSERPGDAHHNDMLEAYVEGEYRPMRYYLDEVEAGQVTVWSVPGGYPSRGEVEAR